MAKAIGYTRVSTDEQVKHGSSLGIQNKDIAEYCKTNNIELVEMFEDAGVSGGNDVSKRKGLNNALEYCKKHKIDKFLVCKMDRLARDVYIQLWIEKELMVCDVEIISINEDNLNGNDYMTKAMRQMVGVFAELEKNRIADRLLSGRRNKIETLKQKASGNCPLGYKYTDNNNPIVVISEERSLIIKEIYKLYLGGLSLQKIADKLNTDGVLTERKGTFSKSSIHVILTNDFYIGIVRFDDLKVTGKHVPIISKSIFGKVKNKLRGNRKLNEGK